MEEQTVEEKTVETKKSKKNKWVIIGIIALTLVVVGGLSGGYLLHLSNTSPEFCQTCHIMEKNVTSYLTSNDMDHSHYLANVACKDCHDYPVPAEVASGINYVFGNYDVTADGELVQVTYDDEMCLECHISMDHLAQKTDFLKRNPHASHFDDLACSDCHISHGQQIDYCSQCHENGGQRILGEEIEPRGTIQ